MRYIEVHFPMSIWLPLFDSNIEIIKRAVWPKHQLFGWLPPLLLLLPIHDLNFSCSNFEVTHWTRNWGQKMTYFDLMTNLQMASSHILLIAINSYFNLCSKSWFRTVKHSPSMFFLLLYYLLFKSVVICLHIKNHWLDSKVVSTKKSWKTWCFF